MTLSRRTFLTLLGATTLVTACGASGEEHEDEFVELPTEIGEDGFPLYVEDSVLGAETLFEHGVASGDPLTDRVILWTRASHEGGSAFRVFWEVARDANFAERVGAGWDVARRRNDFCVKVDALSLPAGTALHYRFRTLGRTSRTGRTKTAPEGDVASLKFALASCSSYAVGHFAAYRHIAEIDDLDAVIHVGDYIYESAANPAKDVRAPEPSHELVTLDDYRARYACHRRDGDLQSLHARHPIFAVWDDHEFVQNAHRDGDGSRAWNDRKSAAKQAYFEWMPVRENDDGTIHRDARFGDLAHLVMLDTRIEGRDAQLPLANRTAHEAPSRSILGSVQEEWLAETLSESNATFALVAQQVMLAPLALVGRARNPIFLNNDQWDGYAPARRRLFELVREHSLENFVVLTGDVHASFASELVESPWGDYVPGDGSALGVEIVTPSIASELVLPEASRALIEAENAHVRYLDLAHRGFVVLDLTPERLIAEWHFLSDVTRPDATALLGARMRLNAGSRRLLTEPL